MKIDHDYRRIIKTIRHEEPDRAPMVELGTDRDDMFRAEDREFLEAVAADKPIRSTVAEGRKSLDVVLAAQHSNP